MKNKHLKQLIEQANESGFQGVFKFPDNSNKEPFIEVTYEYGRPGLGYRLIDGKLYYSGKNGQKLVSTNVSLDSLKSKIMSHAKNVTKMKIDDIQVDGKSLLKEKRNI